MKIRIRTDAATVWGVCLLSLLSCFFIMKMLRSFSGSDVAGGLWNYIQLFMVAAGIICFLLKINTLLRSKPVRSLTAFSYIAALVSIVYISFDRNSIFAFLTILYASGVLSLIYCDGLNRPIEKNQYIIVTFYLISAIYIFSMLSGRQYSTSTGAVADVYYILGLFPLILIYQKKFPIISILVCTTAILLSGKRAGLIAFVVMIFCYYLFNGIQKRRLGSFIKNLLLFALWGFIFLFLFEKVIASFNSNMLERLLRLSADGGSGRADRWQFVITKLGDSNFFQILFGHGRNALSSEFFRAHNDFLEVLYDYGLFALLAYLFFYIHLIREFVQMVRTKYTYAPIMLMSIICSLFLAMFSYYIVEPTYITSGMICYGYLLSDFEKYKCERMEIVS